MNNERKVALADSARTSAGKIAKMIEHMTLEERVYFLELFCAHVQFDLGTQAKVLDQLEADK